MALSSWSGVVNSKNVCGEARDSADASIQPEPLLTTPLPPSYSAEISASAGLSGIYGMGERYPLGDDAAESAA